MPLLHRKPFVRQKPPADLRPDEEVFYCKVTNEIFRHYDDFFERTILCNSLVWSCAVTGRPGLTYQEALESERKARQNLQSFPEPLIVPVLYLTNLTHRSRLHEICDDIFAYIKDRYFVEETVEVIRNNGARLQCRILEVLPPSHQNGFANGHVSSIDGETIVISDSDDSETQNSSFQNGKKKDAIDPLLFKYKVQPTKKELYECAIVKATQISRRKHLFSRDKLKLFLKQHCEPQDGVIKIKASSLSTYKIAEQDFSYFFPDDPPTFIFSPANRRRGRPPKRISVSQEDSIASKQTIAGYRNKTTKERDKLLKQEEMKSLAFEKAKLKREKADALEAKKKEKEDKEKKKEELKKIVEKERLKKKEEKERLKIEREKEREKLREEKKKYMEYLKQWSKPREDMECDDLKELPEPTPVKTRLPPEIFGDALMVLEFLNAFGELFDLQDEFPEGVTLGKCYCYVIVHPKISGLKERIILSQSSVESLDPAIQSSLGVLHVIIVTVAGTGVTSRLTWLSVQGGFFTHMPGTPVFLHMVSCFVRVACTSYVAASAPRGWKQKLSLFLKARPRTAKPCFCRIPLVRPAGIQGGEGIDLIS